MNCSQPAQYWNPKEKGCVECSANCLRCSNFTGSCLECSENFNLVGEEVKRCVVDESKEPAKEVEAAKLLEAFLIRLIFV